MTAGSSLRAGLRVLFPPGSARHTLATVLRALVVAGVLLSADLHFELWANQGFDQIHIIGPLFLLNAIGGLLLAIAVLLWRHWLPTLAAVGFGVATLVAFWLSVTVGLFGLKETASGTPQIVAEVAELVIVVCGVALLIVERAGDWGSIGVAGRGLASPRLPDDLDETS